MADESKGRPIGGIRQYSSLGGGKNVQRAEHSDAQPSDHSNVQEFERQNAQPSKRQKRERDKLTVYLDPEVNTWIRHRIADTREEISDVINLAVRQLMSK